MGANGDHPPHAPHERRRAGGGDPRAGGARVVESARQCWPGRGGPGSAGPTVPAQRWGSGPAEGQGWEGGDETVASSGLDLTGLLRPVREGNAFEETVERLLTIIKLGLVAPGGRFPPEREQIGRAHV